MFFIDGHNDTIIEIERSKQPFYSSEGHISIEKLLNYESPALFFAVYLNNQRVENAYESAMNLIKYFKAEVEANSKYIAHATNYNQLMENRKNNKISAFLALEGGEPLEGNIDKLYEFYDLGIRLVTLTWSRRNALGAGVNTEGDQGLTDFGKQVVKEMNKLGMIVDISHLSEKGFWDVYDIAERPFIASHSNCLKVCSSPRNLTHDQIKALAEKKGLMSLCFYSQFLNGTDSSTIDDVLRHVDHVLNIAGDDFIGLGSDFDGAEDMCIDVPNVTGYKKLYDSLLKGYGQTVADKIFYENYLKIIKEGL